MSLFLSSQQHFQTVSQFESGSKDAAADGSHWTVHNFGNLFILKAINFFEDQHFPKFFWQGGQRGADQRLLFNKFQVSVGAGGGAGINRFLAQLLAGGIQ